MQHDHKPDYRADSAYFLNQAADLLENLTDSLYEKNDHELFSSGVGRHFRHVLDHYACLVDGLESTVNYSARGRDPRLESERTFAIAFARDMASRIQSLAYDRRPVIVESTPGTAEEGQIIRIESSLQRELQFLTSHTIHHYALIGLLLKIQGFSPDADFGVAPSTLRYQASVRADG